MNPSEKRPFAKNLNYLRIRAGLKIQEAADRAGKKRSTWMSYEEDRATPPLYDLPLICAVVGYYDVISMITKDISLIDHQENVVTIAEATTAIQKLQNYIKNNQVKPVI